MKKGRCLQGVLKLLDTLGFLLEMSSGFASVIFFAGMTAVALLGVIFRYVMVNPFEWTEEIARFTMLIVCFLAINIAFRKNEHIAITSFVEMLPSMVIKVLDYCNHALMAFFLVILIKQGFRMSLGTLMTASTIHISMGWIYMFVPLGALLTLIQLVIRVTEKVFAEFGILLNDTTEPN
jgi:TRAP-type C4-dicarboxylate transport system permease small subunit